MRSCHFVNHFFNMSKKRTMLLHRYDGIGDALLINTIAYQLWLQEKKYVWAISNHPTVFLHTPGVRVIPCLSKRWGFRLAHLLQRTGLVTEAVYMAYQAAQPPPYQYLLTAPQGHILSVLAKKVNLAVTPTAPVLFLRKQEIKSWKGLFKNQEWVAIQSTGRTQWTSNKEWHPERFAEVALYIQKRFRVVQLGCASDQALTVDLDLRGKTTPRQAAAVLFYCRGFIGQVGFLMHAAKAVRTPSVIVYGGFESPQQSGYEDNENLYTDLPCAPCWSMRACSRDHACMSLIESADVLRAFERLMQKSNPDKEKPLCA